MNDTHDLLHEAIELIEASYEYMLAYAAQGRDREPAAGGAPSIRQYLGDLDRGLEKIAYGFAEKIEDFDPGSPVRQALEDFKTVMGADADHARKAVRVALGVPSISSQLVDNLNASVHLRSLLTDMFLLDEALKLHRRDDPTLQP